MPRIEDLDKMSLEDITALREKIRRKVETVQEEEKVSQAEKQAQDQDYEYQWAEKNEDEEETDAAIVSYFDFKKKQIIVFNKRHFGYLFFIQILQWVHINGFTKDV